MIIINFEYSKKLSVVVVKNEYLRAKRKTLHSTVLIGTTFLMN